MQVVYILSAYPVLTETFIAREIEQLTVDGHHVRICSFRDLTGVKPARKGLSVAVVPVLYAHLNPGHLIKGIFWALVYRRPIFLNICLELLGVLFQPQAFFRLSTLFVLACHFARTLSNQPPEHIHSHFLFASSVVARWLAALLQIPYSLTVHTSSFQLPRAVVVRNLQQAAFVATISQEAQAMVVRLGADPHSVHIIRNGIRIDQLAVRSDRTTLSQPPLILAVGSLLDKKGFDILIKACAALKNRQVPFRCQIVGEGPERAKLQKLIEHLNLTKSVSLVGHLSFNEVNTAYEQAATLVMPSRQPAKSTRDGLPTVIIEAMARGVPVIATNFAAIPEIVHNYQNGLLVDPEDHQALADAIGLLLQKPSLGKKFAYEARSFVEQNYNLAISVHRLQHLFQQSTQATVESQLTRAVNHRQIQ